MPSFLRIFVADDHAIFRTGLRLTLQDMDAGVQVHDAHDLPSLLKQPDASGPVDAVIADLHMPGMNWYAGIGRLRTRLRPPILVLSSSDDPEGVYACLAAGASGYLHKASPAEVLYPAVRTVPAGGVHRPRDVISESARGTRNPAPTALAAHAPTPAPVLTPRQQQVLACSSKAWPTNALPATCTRARTPSKPMWRPSCAPLAWATACSCCWRPAMRACCGTPTPQRRTETRPALGTAMCRTRRQAPPCTLAHGRVAQRLRCCDRSGAGRV